MNKGRKTNAKDISAKINTILILFQYNTIRLQDNKYQWKTHDTDWT